MCRTSGQRRPFERQPIKPTRAATSVFQPLSTDALRQQVVKAVAKAGEKAAPGSSVDVVFDAEGSELTAWMPANTAPFFTARTL